MDEELEERVKAPLLGPECSLQSHTKKPEIMFRGGKTVVCLWLKAES